MRVVSRFGNENIATGHRAKRCPTAGLTDIPKTSNRDPFETLKAEAESTHKGAPKPPRNPTVNP